MKTNAGKLLCNKCGKYFSTRTITAHTFSCKGDVGARKRTCPKCGKKFYVQGYPTHYKNCKGDAEAVLASRKAKAKESEKPMCIYCGKEFDSERSCRVHESRWCLKKPKMTKWLIEVNRQGRSEHSENAISLFGTEDDVMEAIVEEWGFDSEVTVTKIIESETYKLGSKLVKI